MKFGLCGALIVALGCAASAKLPVRAMVGKSGYATVLKAPPAKISEPPIKRGASSEQAYYAEANHVPLAEAQRRIAAMQALMPEFERLRIKLAATERGNYTDARVVHEPDWAYVLYFKRDPAGTLAKYTHNPRFKAALGRYTKEDLDALIAPWARRFTEAGIVGGYGSDATYGTADFAMSVTEEEYRALAAQKHWGPVPAPIRLGFSGALAFPTVDPRVANLLRHYASERRGTVIQLEAGASGRIFLRDGCLRISGNGSTTAPGALAMFHKETGIGLDAQGYLALIDRTTGKPTGRIGEMFEWGAPNDASEAMPEVIALHAACGPGAVINAGNPTSKFAFDRRYHHN